MSKRMSLVLLTALIICLWFGTAQGQLSGHYPLGSEGIKAATLPPPGMYLRTYTSFYTANVYRNWSAIPGRPDEGMDLDALAVVPRFIWMTDQKILGADYGMDFLVPLIYTDFEINTPGGWVKDNDTCVGDICVEPVDLAWHGGNYDIGAAVAVWMPTGKYNDDRLASPGKDFWTTMFTLGGTYYLDEEKTWSGSVLGRYEINSEMDELDAEPGDDILFEWGLGKTLAKVWDVGVIGYCQWQLTDDSGDDVTWDESVHDRVAGIGPEVSVFIPPAMMFISARCAWEFSAVDRPEGTTVTLTLTKIL